MIILPIIGETEEKLEIKASVKLHVSCFKPHLCLAAEKGGGILQSRGLCKTVTNQRKE